MAIGEKAGSFLFQLTPRPPRGMTGSMDLAFPRGPVRTHGRRVDTPSNAKTRRRPSLGESHEKLGARAVSRFKDQP